MKAMDELRLLPVAERIQLVEELWDSIAEDCERLHLSEAQRAEVDRRLADFKANPAAGDPWEEVRRVLLRKS